MNLDLIKKIYKDGNFQVADHFDDWRDAIRQSLIPLIKNGYATERYYEAVLENIDKWGTYICITPDVCIPHAEGENNGAIKSGIGFLCVRESVHFGNGENENPKLFFPLIAMKSDEHLENLRLLMECLDQPDAIDALLTIRTEDDLLEILDSSGSGRRL